MSRYSIPINLAQPRLANIALVREVGRKETTEFVRTWLLSRYDDAASYRIEVLFADEVTLQEPAETRTLR